MATHIGAYDTNAESSQEALKKVTATTIGTKDKLDVFSESMSLEIAKGNISGTTFIHKFGAAPDFDTSDNEVSVWVWC